MTDSFSARATLDVGSHRYDYFNLAALKARNVDRLPFALKILLENLLRFEDGVNVTQRDIEALLAWKPKAPPEHEIAFTPARVIMQDFTGVPAVVDLAAMREAIVSAATPNASTRSHRPNSSSTTPFRSTNTAAPTRSGTTTK